MAYGERLRELRAERRLSLRQVEERGGPHKDTMSLIERGVHKPHAQTLGKIAQALDVDVRELSAELEAAERPLGEAASSPEQPPLNGFEDEQESEWREAVEKARLLRKDGQARMAELLQAWSKSKARQEPYATRRKYLDEIGELLQQAYEATANLFKAVDEPRFVDKFREVQEADRFYFDLRDKVERAELSISEKFEAAASAKVRRELPRFEVAEAEAA